MSKYDKEVVLERMRARRKAREPAQFEFFMFKPWFIINFVAIAAAWFAVYYFMFVMPWV